MNNYCKWLEQFGDIILLKKLNFHITELVMLGVRHLLHCSKTPTAIAIAKSLTNNTKLKNLSLKENPTTNETGEVLKAFQRLLCNTTNINNRYRESRHSSTINATYNSNHTLEMVNLPAIYSEIGFFLTKHGGK